MPFFCMGCEMKFCSADDGSADDDSQVIRIRGHKTEEELQKCIYYKMYVDAKNLSEKARQLGMGNLFSSDI